MRDDPPDPIEIKEAERQEAIADAASARTKLAEVEEKSAAREAKLSAQLADARGTIAERDRQVNDLHSAIHEAAQRGESVASLETTIAEQADEITQLKAAAAAADVEYRAQIGRMNDYMVAMAIEVETKLGAPPEATPPDAIAAGAVSSAKRPRKK